MSQIPIATPFQQLASYEKPQLLLTQALDNELTVRGALQTLVDVDGLSPQERDLFTDRLKDKVGRNAVTDAVVDIATNPFVLLMAVTAPVGAQALSRTGKAIFDMGAKFNPLVKEQGGMHAALGMLAPMQLFRGTALTPTVQTMTRGVDTLEKEMMGVVAEPLRKVLERHGLDSLDPAKVTDLLKKQKAEDLNDLLAASLMGADRELSRDIWKMVRVVDGKVVKKVSKKEFAEKGAYELRKVATKKTGALVKADLEKLLDKEGLRGLRDAFRKATEQRRMKLFGDEVESARTGKFVADEQKVLRMWDGLRMGLQGKGAMGGTGAEMAAIVMGPELAAQIAAGRVQKGEVLGKLKEMIEGQDVSSYLSRNIVDLKGTTDVGRIMEQRRSRALVATGATLSRVSGSGRFDPDDLKRLYGKFGSTDAGDKLLRQSEKKIESMIAKGETARVYRINAQESLSRYFRDTGLTHALYVQTVDQSPRLKQAYESMLGMAKPEKMTALEEDLIRSPAVAKDKMSIAEALYRQHYLLEDKFAKESLETILRGAVGVQKIEHVATHMALIKGKQALSAVLDSPIGSAMRKSGKWGEGLYQRLKGSVDAEMTFGEAKGISGALARYFYVTHLGLNLASVTMNMMQPLLLASSWGGLGNVMKAYTSAFKEMGGYVSERVGKYGFKALTDEQHAALIGKHFKFANVDGENLVQIGRDTFSTLDSISYKSEALAGVTRRESYFYDYPMKMFEKAEWLNRNVAAHTVENLYRSKGIDVAPGKAGYYRMLTDVDEMVGASQFGGSTLNTPMAFQGVGPLGRLGNNPLFRQFLSFPLRSATSLTYDAARLGERGVIKGMTQDLVRGMGVSAIFYEVGKNTFGVDLSQGLYGASLTQAVGGDRFFQDGNEYIPIPPVVDIPMNIIRGALDPGQRELLQNNIPRLVPGGIAIARAMNMAPNMPESPLFGLPGALQRTYVDFSQRTPEGMVAVFKGDGTLIDYQSPGMIYAKQLGLDMGTFKSTADIDGYLLKNREQVVEYRRRAIQALLNNEIPKMQATRAEFKRRFGMELTISKDQLDDAMKNRTVSRTERIMDRMPPDLRPQYQAMLASRAPNLGLTEEQVTGAETARQRMQNRRIETRPLTAEQQQLMQELPAQAESAKQGFGTFQGY